MADINTVLIVDDIKILRECLKMAISKFPNFEVVGCGSDGYEAIALCELKKPDIILMDLNMPKCSGHEAIISIKKTYKHIKILVLSVEGDEINIAKAFKNGADGYVLKDISPEELEDVLKKTIVGENFVQDNAFSLGKKVIENDKKVSRVLSYLDIDFTEREKEVLKLVVEGMTNEEIGKELFISAGRARNVVGELIAKCEVKNRTQLAVIASKLSSY